MVSLRIFLGIVGVAGTHASSLFGTLSFRTAEPTLSMPAVITSAPLASIASSPWLSMSNDTSRTKNELPRAPKVFTQYCTTPGIPLFIFQTGLASQSAGSTLCDNIAINSQVGTFLSQRITDANYLTTTIGSLLSFCTLSNSRVWVQNLCTYVTLNTATVVNCLTQNSYFVCGLTTPSPTICLGTSSVNFGGNIYFYVLTTGSGLDALDGSSVCQFATPTGLVGTQPGQTFTGSYVSISDFMALNTLGEMYLVRGCVAAGAAGAFYLSTPTTSCYRAAIRNVSPYSEFTTATVPCSASTFSPGYLCAIRLQTRSYCTPTSPATAGGLYLALETGLSGQQAGTADCTQAQSVPGLYGTFLTVTNSAILTSVSALLSRCFMTTAWVANTQSAQAGCFYYSTGPAVLTSTFCQAPAASVYVCQYASITSSTPTFTPTFTQTTTSTIIVSVTTTVSTTTLVLGQTTTTITSTVSTRLFTATSATTSTRTLVSKSEIITTTTSGTTISTTSTDLSILSTTVTVVERETDLSTSASTSTSVDLDSETTTQTVLRTRTSCPLSPVTLTQTTTVTTGSVQTVTRTCSFRTTTTLTTETVDLRSTSSTSTVTRTVKSTATTTRIETTVEFGLQRQSVDLCLDYALADVRNCSLPSELAPLVLAYLPVDYGHRECGCRRLGLQVAVIDDRNGPKALRAFDTVRFCVGETAKAWIDSSANLQSEQNQQQQCLHVDLQASQPDIMATSFSCRYEYAVLCE